jgi:hypothetical protein
MQIDVLPDSFERDRYNRLRTIEEANAAVRFDNRLDEYLDSASRLFVRHGMHERFGVALLHQHNAVDAGERMIQRPTVVDGRNALITYPIVSDGVPPDAVGSVWECTGEGFAPLEFTTDALARELVLHDEIPPAFLADFAQLTERSPIGHLLGLAVVERGLYREAAVDEGALEHSTTARENIMTLERREPGKHIETSWSFTAVIDRNDPLQANTECQSGCKTSCVIVQLDPANKIHDKPHAPHHWPPGTAP